MSTTSGTPRPWPWYIADDGITIHVKPRTEDGSDLVADAHHYEGFRSYAEAKANAALIAAAPDLLKACKVFVERAYWCEKSGSSAQAAAVMIFRERIEACCAAIARAEGAK